MEKVRIKVPDPQRSKALTHWGSAILGCSARSLHHSRIPQSSGSPCGLMKDADKSTVRKVSERCFFVCSHRREP